MAFDYAKRLTIGETQAEGVLSASLSALYGTAARGTGWAQCRLLNQSVCAATQAGKVPITVSIWNQLGQERTETVLLPVGGASGVTIKDAATGDVIPHQVMDLIDPVTNYKRTAAPDGESTVAFQVALPALGSATVTIDTTGAQQPQVEAAAAVRHFPAQTFPF